VWREKRRRRRRRRREFEGGEGEELIFGDNGEEYLGQCRALSSECGAQEKEGECEKFYFSS